MNKSTFNESSSSSLVVNENDFDSPGFEYLRSYQNTINLYNKLVALNYQNEFCSLYKCRAIHKYYFSTPSDNANEQQFTFLCLCAWLIKHKCQMNLQLEPEDYEDPDLTIETILEALRLLQADGNEPVSQSAFNAWLGFPSSRLKNSYGPEIVWAMNILADRALELQRIEQRQQLAATSKTTSQQIRKTPARVIYRNSDQKQSTGDSITIGQPLVGGGLTTRPLGTYRIDDDALQLPGGCATYWSNNNKSDQGENIMISSKPLVGEEANEWLQQVDIASTYLESIDLSKSQEEDANQHTGPLIDWHDCLESVEESKEVINRFLLDCKQPLQNIESRTRRELQVIWAREKFIQTQASQEIEQFLTTWRQYSAQLKSNSELESLTNRKMELFERLNDKLRNTRQEYEKRARDLAEGRHLKELELKIDRLQKEKSQFDLKIGLLMSVYANKQTKLLNKDNRID